MDSTTAGENWPVGAGRRAFGGLPGCSAAAPNGRRSAGTSLQVGLPRGARGVFARVVVEGGTLAGAPKPLGKFEQHIDIFSQI